MNRSGERPVFVRIAALCAFFAVLVQSGCAGWQTPEPPDYFWTVHSRERSDADRVLDQDRRPEKLLAFWEVRPGMRVADLGAGDGYFAELLARIVGPQGRVYAQVGRGGSAHAAARFAARAKKPVMANVTYFVRDFENPLPADVRALDLVTSNFQYHALLRAGVDRARMNRAVFEALKPGGVYAVTDYAGRPGAAPAEAGALERTDEALLRREVQAAGFRLADEAKVLRSSADPRDVPVSALAGRADAFVLKFVKP